MSESPSAQGIVLAGTFHWGGSSFDRLLPRPLVPVAQTPLICYALRWLRDAGVARATVCANSAARSVRTCLGDGSSLGMRLDYLEDWTPRGAAGCARDAALRTEAETFIIADGTAVPAVDLGALLETHHSSHAALTVAVHDDGIGERLTPAGIYVFDRRALCVVSERGFQDIKEGLIPRLHQSGERVVTHAAFGACPRVLDAETYLAVNHWTIERVADRPGFLDGYFAIDESLAHPTARIEDGARIVGPVLLGPAVVVRAGATVIGPTALGARTTVDAGALVSRSVTWGDCAVGEQALVDRCLLADHASVERGASLYGSVRLPTRAPRRSLGELLRPWRGQQPSAVPSLTGPSPERAGTA